MTSLENAFKAWTADKGITSKFESLVIDGILRVNEIDTEGTIKANNLLNDPEKAQMIRDWVTDENLSNDTPRHWDAFVSSYDTEKKIAATCSK